MKSKVDSADFIEQNSYEVGFAEFYKNKIKPSAASLEDMRMKHLKKIAWRARLTLLAWLILPFSQSGEVTPADNAVALAISFTFVFGFLLFLPAIIYWPISQFKREFEEKLLEEIFGFFSNSHYEKKRELEEGILGDYDRFKIFWPLTGYGIRLLSQNYLSIKRKDVNFSLERIEIRAHIRGGWRYLFNGTSILLDVNSDFKTRTVVIKNHLRNWNFKYIYQARTKVELQKVEFQDQEFDKMFKVYSEDMIEAQSLVKPEFRDALKKLPKLLNSKKIQASFCDKKLLLTLDGGVNLFQLNASVFKPIDLVGECKQILQQMELIFSAIDALGVKSKN